MPLNNHLPVLKEADEDGDEPDPILDEAVNAKQGGKSNCEVNDSQKKIGMF